MAERFVWLSCCQKSSLFKLGILIQVWSDFRKLFLPCCWTRFDLVYMYLQSNHRLNLEISSVLKVPIKLLLSSVGNTVSVFFSEVMYSIVSCFQKSLHYSILMSLLICICNFVDWFHRFHRCKFFSIELLVVWKAVMCTAFL